MITGIGQTAADMWPIRASGDASAGLMLTPLGATDSNSAGLLKRAPEETIQAGFGRGTVSVPGVVKRTIDKNIQGAKRLSAWEAARAKRAANRQTQPSRTAKDALGVVTAMNRSASVTEARLAGEKPVTAAATATLTVNGQSVSYVASARQAPDTTTGASRLNILV